MIAGKVFGSWRWKKKILSPDREQKMTEIDKTAHSAELAAMIRERINTCLSANRPLQVLPLENDLLRTFPDFRDRRVIRDKITALAIARGVPLLMEDRDTRR
ncbi:hypothetical protein [Chelatococcus sp. YT9]|uniref:hypothetical protein n=1 Tax=Chelatococcus sp. YT9 TaxID=2835635 RepID=UPI001BCDF7F7|nr:hypothetical protein [Chelatococcus sp. YT9]MBS7700016.1 hypothetical protein [Chelatococcus sp. YT9]